MSTRDELARVAALEHGLLAAERVRAASDNPLLSYACHFHRTDRGDPLSFVGRPWLLALYAMWGKEPPQGTDVTFMKATQVGITELGIVACWAWCGERGYRVMYVLPREEDRTAFYAMRIKKAMKHTPRYQALTKQSPFDSRSEYIMSIGRGAFRLAGSNAAATFVSTPLDAYVIDEVDRCDQENILLAEDRLSWPDSRKVRIRIGNPTTAAFGISKLYEQGTKHRWHVPCTSCRVEVAPDFFEHAVREGADGTYVPRDEERAGRPELGDLRLVCRCGGFLDRTGAGRWVPTHPGRPRQSFHIGKLIDGAVSVRSLVDRHREAEEDPATLQRFWNSDLGLPYEPKGGKLTLAVILSRRFQYRELPAEQWSPARTMGIDVGSPHTVVVSDLPMGDKLEEILLNLGKAAPRRVRPVAFDPLLDKEPKVVKQRPMRRLLFAGKVKSLEAIDELVRRYRPRAICIDAFPEVEAVQAARRRWGPIVGSIHRIWRVQYLFDRLQDIALDYREGIAKVDRTRVLDLQVRDWMDGYRIVPANVELLARGQYIDELCMPTRVEEEGARGIPVSRWTKGKDHFFHAEGYDRLAAELCRVGQVTTGHIDLATFGQGL